MGTAVLVDALIDGGFDLLAALRRRGFDIAAAGWLFSDEDDAWQLYLVAASYPDGSKTRGYQVIIDSLRECGADIDPDDIRLVRADQPIGRWLSEVRLKTGMSGTGMMVFRGTAEWTGHGFTEGRMYPPPGPLPPDQVVRVVADYLRRGAGRPAAFEMGTTARQLEPVGIRRDVGTRQLVIEAHNPTTGQNEFIPADEITGIRIP